MPTNTTNYNLVKPTKATDNADIDVVNGNMDVIDTQLKANADAASTAQQNLTAHNASNVKHVPHLGTTTNVGNAYTVVTTEVIAANQKFTVKINAASTGAAILTIASLGAAKAIKKAGGLDAILKIGVYTLFYEGVNFQLLGEGGDYGTAGAAQTLAGYTAGRETGIVAGSIPVMMNGRPLSSDVGYYEAGGTFYALMPDNQYLTGNDNFLKITDPALIAPNFLDTKNVLGLQGGIPDLAGQTKPLINHSHAMTVVVDSSDSRMGIIDMPNALAGEGRITNLTRFTAQLWGLLPENIMEGAYIGQHNSYGTGQMYGTAKPRLYASGNVTSSATTASFIGADGTASLGTDYFVEVNGLSFLPKVIVILSNALTADNYRRNTIYSEGGNFTNYSTNSSDGVRTNGSGIQSEVRCNTLPAYVSATGFKLPVDNASASLSHKWVAYA